MATSGAEAQSTVTADCSTVQHEEGNGSGSDDGLPRSFDVLIIGTGLTESIVSAAVSRSGHTVLHLDPREYYGGNWATFSFDQWTAASFMDIPDGAKAADVTLKEEKGKLRWKDSVRNFEQVWYGQDEDSKDEILKQKRRFNIDLMPKLIAAREDIVQLLITSNVSRYLEFLRVAKLLTNLPPPKEDVIESIPLSRAEIFTSKSLSLVEKRSLVKLIEAVLQPPKGEQTDTDSSTGTGESSPTATHTFEELAETVKVPPKLRHMVKSSITTLDDGFAPNGETFNREFCSRCSLFLNSIGRYGNQTPFLWTLYGISEICQAFCRLSAVYGGIFILKRHVSKIETSDKGYTFHTDGKKIEAKHIVLGPDLERDIFENERSKKEQTSILVGRAVLVTKGDNILKVEEDRDRKSKGDGIYVYRISGLEVIEMNHNSQAVPKDFRLIHVSFPLLDADVEPSRLRQTIESRLSSFLDFHDHPPTNVEEDADRAGSLEATNDGTGANSNLSNLKPKVVYGSYFCVENSCDSVRSEIYKHTDENNSNCFILDCDIASTELTNYVSKAKEIFSTLYPEEEFLPKAPDAEDAEDSMNGDDNYIPEPPELEDLEGAAAENPAALNDSPEQESNEPAMQPSAASDE